MSNKVKLILVIISIFIVMPINGYLFTVYPIWFPLILIFAQMPMLIGILLEWYQQVENPPRVNNLPGHREQRMGTEL